MIHHHEIHLGPAWEPPVPSAGGRAHWIRRFGRPAGLEAGDRVLLVVTQSAVVAELVLNAVPLPPLPAGSARWTYDVTPLLRDRNELVFAVDSERHRGIGPDRHDGDRHGRGPLPAACGRVAIEIVPAARHA